MKVKVITLEHRDERHSIEITIDEKMMFHAFDGEPEDNTLMRNFNDAYNIVDIIREAHAAGTRGEPLEIEETDEDI